MELSAVVHQPKSALCYANGAEALHLRIKTKQNDVRAVTLVIADPYNWAPSPGNPNEFIFAAGSFLTLEMAREQATRFHDCWFAAVPAFRAGRYKYAFFLDDAGGRRWFWGGRGATEVPAGTLPVMEHFLYYNLPATLPEDRYAAPAWVQDTIWYHVFPDRFSRGGQPQDFGANCTGPYKSQQRAGGNLQGIIERLDHICGLGCTGLYLTPIFKAGSSHKYDTVDYFTIDPDFGDNADFARLVEQAHRRGIRVMLDAVLNHCGGGHPFWQDVLQKGRNSEYFDCFYILDPDKPVAPDPNAPPESRYDGSYLNYLTFGYTENMPKWNTAHPLVRNYLLDVGAYWVENYGIDAWRLDVSNEVSHDFWRAFRKRVKGANPQAYLLGENWFFSNPWLRGDQMDAVMNYELRAAITNFFGAGGGKTTASGFCRAVGGLLVEYPKNVTVNLFNMLDTHDTARILTLCGGNRRVALLAYVFLFTFPGCPSIYYGSEVGLAGGEEDNRRCMPWAPGEWDAGLLEAVRGLVALRGRCPACRSAELTWLFADDDAACVIYKKGYEEQPLYVVLNNSPNTCTAALPAEMAGTALRDEMAGKPLEPGGGIALEGYGFLLLSPTKS